MIWTALDLALGFLVLVVLGVAVLRLWRRVKVLTRQVKAASAAVGPATDALAAAQAAAPHGD